MLTRFSLVLAIAMVPLLAGCGGEEEVKKNDGKIENVAPTAAAPPGGGAAPAGSAAPGAPASNQAKPPPPIPKINE